MSENSLIAGKALDESLPDPLLQRIHRTFAIFSGNSCHISPQQAYFILGHLHRLNGGTEQVQSSLSTLIRSSTVTFHDLLRMCDLLFPDRKQFEPLVDRIFERYVKQIISKGFLLYCNKNKKKSCLVGSNKYKWRAYWCTVTPGAIHLWPMHKSTNAANRKTIVLDNKSAVHIGTFDEERFTWMLTADTKQICLFGHFDELLRKQWMSAMKLAMERRSMEELMEYDQKSSLSAECRTSPDKNLSWRLALECENERLMQLLDDQRRALRDEEIVRTLAARMLDEERERREKLEEKLQCLEKNLNEKYSNSKLEGFIIKRLNCSNDCLNKSLENGISVQKNVEDSDDTLSKSSSV